MESKKKKKAEIILGQIKAFRTELKAMRDFDNMNAMTLLPAQTILETHNKYLKDVMEILKDNPVALEAINHIKPLANDDSVVVFINTAIINSALLEETLKVGLTR